MRMNIIRGGIRSFKSILRQYGYRVAHDIWFPSFIDGYDATEMKHSMIMNAVYSKKDALIYYGERTLPHENILSSINALRHRIASGAIANAIEDSRNDEQQIKYWNQILDYCAKTGVKVVSKAQAYDICFNKRFEDGNLIYNPTLRNSLQEYLPEAEENNPDGYIGECKVENKDDVPTLIILGETKYSHYGIPVGKISYSANIKGKGTIRIYLLRNKTKINTEDEMLDSLNINNDVFEDGHIYLNIPDAPLTTYECRFEGWGEKVCGVRIVDSGGLEIRNIDLRKIERK